MNAESLDLWLEDTWNDQLALRLRLRACLHQMTTPFQRIAVYESFALGRILCLGGSIVLTEADEAVYSEGLVHPALQCHDRPRSALVLGGGDGGICRQLVRYADLESITVVEIDPEVVTASREWFPHLAESFADPRVQLVTDDAHRFLSASEQRYDIIVVDADHLHEPAAEIVRNLPLAQLLASHLAADGVAIAPLGIPTMAGEACRGALLQLRQAFARTAVYQVTTPSILGQQWAVAWCSAGREPELAEPPPMIDGDNEFWEPVVHPALFALPPVIRRRLGL